MNLDLSKIKTVHFIGIGGIGISAIARMMIHEGKNVTGQDMQEGEIIEGLRKIGIDIKIGQSYENIPKNSDLIVYTVAIETYDKEFFDKLKDTKEFEVRSYPQMLGLISKDKYTIAICGTHGKTTTTGMLAQIFQDGGLDPTVIVGSLLKDKNNLNTNFIGGKSKYFIVEACEYRRSFLNINPNIVVITNIDKDHLDYYKDIRDIKNAFQEFVMKVPNDGYIVCNLDDKNIKDVIENTKAKIINWGDYFKKDINLKIPGIYNKKNAAAAAAAAAILNISSVESEKILEQFSGVWRRFEYKGKLSNGILVYDDYAHHPVEIISTLQGFRELYPKGKGWKITVVFQPHLFSRTKFFLNDFAQSFKEADEVILLPIYYAREVNDGSVSSAILADEINKYGKKATGFLNFKSVEELLESRLKDYSNHNIIVTMGAGLAFKIGDFLLKE